jgi:cupin fold WbuC family metalloprotein
MQLIRESAEVYYAAERPAAVGDGDVAFLKARALENERLRSRLCLHESPAASEHEMLIVHHRACYVRPHRHPVKSETLQVVEGEALAVIFDDDGRVATRMHLAPPGSGETFSYYMPAGAWHSVIILSTWFVFLEATAGPFLRSGTEFPDWAPDGSDAAAAAAYAAALCTEVVPG